MKVKIHYIEEEESYTAESEADCRDEFDRRLYRTVVEHGKTICMGKFVGEPIQ